MNRPIWITLALLHDSKMAMVDWRRLLEGHFDCVQRYLEKCPGEIAGTLPCPSSGQRLHVGKREGMYIAFPEEGFESDSDSLADLTEDDVALWRLERGRFESDLSRAMGLVPLERTAGLSKLLSLIGTAGQGKSRKRVYLGYAANERAGVDVCVAVARESQCPCCVALPVFYPACDEMLRRSDFEYIVLEEAVTIGVSGMVGKARAVQAAVAEAPQLARFLIQRGVNTWRVVFDGVELPGLGKDRGMFFVAYLAGKAGDDPIHALDLEAKVSRFYRKDCGLPEIVNPEGEEPVTVNADAVLQEYDLNRDNGRLAELMRIEERNAVATIENQKASRAAKAEALKKVQAIREYRVNHFGKNSSPANDAAKRVRTAIDRLLDALSDMKPGGAKEARAVSAFADFIRQNIRQASLILWPKGGFRSKKADWQPGHFRCLKMEGVDWVVT